MPIPLHRHSHGDEKGMKGVHRRMVYSRGFPHRNANGYTWPVDLVFSSNII